MLVSCSLQAVSWGVGQRKAQVIPGVSHQRTTSQLDRNLMRNLKGGVCQHVKTEKRNGEVLLSHFRNWQMEMPKEKNWNLFGFNFSSQTIANSSQTIARFWWILKSLWSMGKLMPQKSMLARRCRAKLENNDGASFKWYRSRAAKKKQLVGLTHIIFLRLGGRGCQCVLDRCPGGGNYIKRPQITQISVRK